MDNATVVGDGVSRTTQVRLLLVVASMVVSACGGANNQGLSEFQIEDITTVVSTESELLRRPVELKIDESGNVFVLDGMSSQIFMLSPTGELLRGELEARLSSGSASP